MDEDHDDFASSDSSSDYDGYNEDPFVLAQHTWSAKKDDMKQF